MNTVDAADPLEAALERARRRPLRMAISPSIEPFSQGYLDRFCGLYAAVNALRLIAADRQQSFSESASLRLFQHGATFLDAHGKLSAAVRYGLRWRLWVKVVGELADRAGRALKLDLFVEQPFQRADGVTLDDFIPLVRRAIDARSPVLVLLKGTYDHFTVIVGVTPKRLILFDSCGYRWLSLASCELGHKASQTRHLIHTPSVLILRA